ncbi:MAG: energy-coupling factor transporter transmembrane protein EcfT [Marmoricola sp.]
MGTAASLSVPRAVHPLAWWGWAIGLAVAANTTTNPLLLALILGVITTVVVARRTDSPWARAFRLYLGLGAVIVAFRVVLHVLVGSKYGTVTVLPLPRVHLPHWAAGIEVLGTVYLEGWLGALLLGAQLAMIIVAIGGANALANPKRLLRSLPNALHEVGTAVVVSVSVAPQLAESVQRVLRARLLRGDAERGLRAVPRVALPVLQDTLDRSLLLASAMESRGYGRRPEVAGAARDRVVVGFLTLGGLLATAFGMYGVLDPLDGLGWAGGPVLVAGLAASFAGLYLGGRHVRVTTYRPDPWLLPETLTLLSGALAGTLCIVERNLDPDAMLMPLAPLAAPALPVLAAVGIVLALAPAFLTPPPPTRNRVAASATRSSSRGDLT